MDLRAIAKLVTLKANDSAYLDDILREYGISLDFDEKVQLVRMLSQDFSVIYDVVSDRFILVKSRRAAESQEAQGI